MNLEMLCPFQEIPIDMNDRIQTIFTKPEERIEELATALIDHVDKIKSIMNNYFFVKMVQRKRKN